MIEKKMLDASVLRTAGKLADNRDIFFYDDAQEYVSGEKTRQIFDPRPLEPRVLPPHQSASTRRDPLTGQYVTIAAHRQNRTFLPPADEDPLAPAGQGSVPSEIPESSYDVVVFENRFPSLQGPLEILSDTPLRYETTPAGRCEVVCFTPEQDGSFAELSFTRARTVFEAWKDRTADLLSQQNIKEVFIFENRGQEIGVTLHHPHGQIYAYSYLTPYTSQVAGEAAKYAEQLGGDLLGQVLEQELQDGVRIVEQTENFVVFVPFAAKWPVELMIMPRGSYRNFTEFTSQQMDELTALYLRTLKRFTSFFGDIPLPYISGWHQVPVSGADEVSRMYLHLFTLLRDPGKLKYLAGSESAKAAWINDRTPENIAQGLKEIQL